jgi:hypothetical protein
MLIRLFHHSAAVKNQTHFFLLRFHHLFLQKDFIFGRLYLKVYYLRIRIAGSSTWQQQAEKCAGSSWIAG